MSTKWLYLVILLLVIGYQQAGIGADKAALPVNEVIADAELDKQLRINRDALLKGSSEQIRIDAAGVMLFSEEPSARKILLAVLRQSENKSARTAVCRALSKTRGRKETIKDKEDFLEPLLEILSTEEDSELAKLAAEAILIFEYKQVSKPLGEMAADASLGAKARLNAVGALKLQPDKRAILKLIGLLDDTDKEVAAAAEKALTSLGIPVAGKDAKTRRQIIKELKSKGRDEFLRDWLIRQERQMSQLKEERDLWQRQYLAALDKIYDLTVEDDAKGQFLAKHLNNSGTAMKLWSLEKVSEWLKGTKPKLPAELGPILVGLISEKDRDVRLKTANLLSLMGHLNSAEELLEQLKIEEDDQVRMELFVALGVACHYALLPDSDVRVPPEIRKSTLKWAEKYLAEENPQMAQKGAEVIRKLLEQDGLKAFEVDKYLGLLAKRYEQQENNADEALRGELLNVMAGLCARSVYKDKAARLFEPLFDAELRDETDMVREAAATGLIYIDKTKALNRLRRDFVNDSSVIVRKKLIALAGEVGGKEDLDWLAEKIGTSAESEQGWEVMLKIFKGCDAAVLDKWLSKFSSENGQARLSDEQKLSFLEIAKAKATGEKMPEMLKDVRERLARLHKKRGEFERAAEYLGMMNDSAASAEEKEPILAELMEVYLNWPNVEAAANLVANRLSEKDLGPNDVIVQLIDKYLDESADVVDGEAILKELLAKIEAPSEARPKWQEQVNRWNERLKPDEEPEQPKEAGEKPENQIRLKKRAGKA